MTLLRIGPTHGRLPLHDSAASRRAEQAALAEVAPRSLMEAAGLSVARLALASVPHARRVQVWAGPGNNGGDGLVAARLLHEHGLEVAVSLLADPARLPADAAHALHAAQAAGVPLLAGPGMPEPGLVIDALLGLGTRRAPEGPLLDAIARINAGSAPVLSIDLPSGLHPDTGTVLGSQAVRAFNTLSLLTLKPGCFTGVGRDHSGAVWLDSLAVDAGPPTAWLAGPAPVTARRHATHKGSYGDVAVVGGAAGMTGAAWLAARAALTAGAGRVYCSLLDSSAALLDPQCPELMGRPRWWQAPPPTLTATTVACGCGAGHGTLNEALPPLLTHAGRLVLDADALNTIAFDTALQDLLRRRATRGLGTVLTPHPLEAARLLRSHTAAVQSDRIAAARTLAASFNCCVLLKGSGSVIATPGELPMINPTANAALASPGTGDVLAGWTAGLWSQSPGESATAIASRAAWQHGRAADLWSADGHHGALRASLLVEALSAL